MGWPVIVSKSVKSSYRSGRVSQESLGLFRGDRPLFALAGWICHSARYCWVRPPVKMKHAVETSVLSLFIFYWWFCWLCSPLADRSCAVFLFFRAIMEHKELLKVQWDWQIGKPLILSFHTWFDCLSRNLSWIQSPSPCTHKSLFTVHNWH